MKDQIISVLTKYRAEQFRRGKSCDAITLCIMVLSAYKENMLFHEDVEMKAILLNALESMVA